MHRDQFSRDPKNTSRPSGSTPTHNARNNRSDHSAKDDRNRDHRNRDDRNFRSNRSARRPQGGGAHSGHQGRQIHPDQLLQEYDAVMAKHLEARRKYFELYFRADYNRLAQLEDQFYQTGLEVRNFERQLKPWQLQELQRKKTEFFPLDDEYSKNHPEGEVDLPVSAFPTTNFHLVPTQLERPKYKEDTEEGEGTYEDYIAYKNLVGGRR